MPRARRASTLILMLLSAAVAAALLLPSGRAGAVDSAKPKPCTPEPLITDKGGDQEFDPSGGLGLGAHPGNDNADITAVFMNYRPGSDGKPVLTANVQITNLNKTLPSFFDSQGGLYYYVVWELEGAVRFVKAVNADGATITYAYGTIDPDLGVYTTEGDTKGAFFEGAQGVVQIDVPEAAGGKAGATLKNVEAFTDTILGFDDFIGLNVHADAAPNEATIPPKGVDYTATLCAGGAPAPAGTKPVAVTTAALPFKASSSLGSAKKAKKGKTLILKVKATKPITKLQVTLKPASGKGATLGSGSLAELSGSGKLKLKLKSNLKKGSYSLLSTGTVGGKKLKASQKVSVK